MIFNPPLWLTVIPFVIGIPWLIGAVAWDRRERVRARRAPMRNVIFFPVHSQVAHPGPPIDRSGEMRSVLP